jgi:hypothetical protein
MAQNVGLLISGMCSFNRPTGPAGKQVVYLLLAWTICCRLGLLNHENEEDQGCKSLLRTVFTGALDQSAGTCTSRHICSSCCSGADLLLLCLRCPKALPSKRQLQYPHVA